MSRPETRERRPILSARRPEITSLLAGLDDVFLTTAQRLQLQAMAAKLWDERNAWDVARRRKAVRHG